MAGRRKFCVGATTAADLHLAGPKDLNSELRSAEIRPARMLLGVMGHSSCMQLFGKPEPCQPNYSAASGTRASGLIVHPRSRRELWIQFATLSHLHYPPGKFPTQRKLKPVWPSFFQHALAASIRIWICRLRSSLRSLQKSQAHSHRISDSPRSQLTNRRIKRSSTTWSRPGVTSTAS